jgi:hypothetical protein
MISAMIKVRWRAKLSRAIELRDGTKLRTLADARSFILDRVPKEDQQRDSWLIAIERLIEAAEQGRSIEDATRALEVALFLQAPLRLL